MAKKTIFNNNFQNLLILILSLLIIYLLIKLVNYPASENSELNSENLVEGFYSSSNSRKMQQKFKKIKNRNKDNFKNVRDEKTNEKFEPDKIPSLADALRKSDLVKTSNREKMKSPVAERIRKNMEKYSRSLNKGILGRKSKNLEDSLKKFDKLKEKFWDIFDRE